MNDCKFFGRITRDIDYKVSNGEKGELKIARTGMALFEYRKDGKSTFINLVAYGDHAERLHKYVKKGQRLLITKSRVQTGSYEKDGTKVNFVEFIIDDMEFVEKKDAEETPNNSAPATNNNYSAPAPAPAQPTPAPAPAPVPTPAASTFPPQEAAPVNNGYQQAPVFPPMGDDSLPPWMR